MKGSDLSQLPKNMERTGRLEVVWRTIHTNDAGSHQLASIFEVAMQQKARQTAPVAHGHGQLAESPDSMLLRRHVDEAFSGNVGRYLFLSQATGHVAVGIANCLDKAAEESVSLFLKSCHRVLSCNVSDACRGEMPRAADAMKRATKTSNVIVRPSNVFSRCCRTELDRQCAYPQP